MHRKHFILALVFFSPVLILGWQINYGSERIDISYNIEPTSDEGFIVSGFSEHPSVDWYDAYFMKLDITGTQEWEIYFGGEWYQDRGYDGVEVDGGYIFTGWTSSYGAMGNDIFALMVSETGDTLWHRKYGTLSSDHAYDICKTHDEHLILAGDTYAYGTGDADAYLCKINTRGDTIWTNHYGSTEFERINKVIELIDGSLIAVGSSWSEGVIPDTNIYVLKIDSDGTELWSQVWDIGYDDGGWSLCEEPTGNIVVAGFTSPEPGHPNIYIKRISPSGDSLWANTYGGPGHDIAHGIVSLDDGSLVVAGWSTYEAYIMKLDREGEIVWDNSIGSVRDDRFFSISKNGTGFVMSGSTKSYGEGSPDTEDFFIVTANSEGDAGSDCYPAFVWCDCPHPAGTTVGCADQPMIFGIVDPTGISIDTESIYGRKIVSTISGEIDTTVFSHDHEDISIEVRSDTVYLSINGTYEHGTRVNCIIDSLSNEEDCVSYPDQESNFTVDLEPPYISSFLPSPGSYVDPAIETLMMKAEIVDDMSGVRSDSASAYIRWIANDFERPFFRWNWDFGTNRTTTFDTFELGDSIKVCIHAEENTNDGYCITCDHRELDTCWVFYFGEGGDTYIQEYDVFAGWNMISSPFAIPFSLGDYFTEAITPYYTFNTESGLYEEIDEIEVGLGVWVLNTEDALISVEEGEVLESIEISLQTGWNLVGGPSLSVPSAPIEDLEETIPPVYTYDGDIYIAADSLMPGKGYWILSREDISITLP
ncbi:MAG: hypothetical protein ACLFSQ_08170 [Candidatus Zixiibacteriota bacterium]